MMKMDEYKFVPITEPDEFDKILVDMSKVEEIAVDTETSSLDTLTLELLGMSFCWEPGWAYYVPKEVVLSRLEPLQYLWDTKTLIWANAKFEIQVCKRVGLRPPTADRFIDIIAWDYLLDPDIGHGLKAQAKRYGDWDMTDFEDLTDDVSFDKLSIVKQTNYAAADAAATYEIRHQLHKRIKYFGDLVGMDNAIIPVLSDMELTGIAMDTEVLKAYRAPLQMKLRHLKSEMFELAGKDFEPDSPAQVGDVLYNVLNMPVTKRTKKGKASTNALALEQLVGRHPIVQKIIDYREFTKLKTNFVEGVLKGVSKVDGACHASYLTTIVPTGRLACGTGSIGGGGYNVQQIPKKGKVVELEGDFTEDQIKMFKVLGAEVELVGNSDVLSGGENGGSIYESVEKVIS